MKNIEEKIWEALKKVDDPDFKKDLVSLGMAKKVQVKDKTIFIEIELTTPACPLKGQIQNDIEKAVAETLGNKEFNVQVEFTSHPSRWQQNTRLELPQVNHIIAVASGKGGVGKSTVAANLAVSLALNGAKVGLVDADIYGPSIPRIFGVEDYRPELTQYQGRDWMIPAFQYHVYLMSIGFLVPPEKAVAWRGPMASNALRQMITDTLWPQLDYLVVDLPPGTGDIQMTLAQMFRLTGSVVVTTPQKLALMDAQKSIDMFLLPSINIPVFGVIENMSYFEPPCCQGTKYYLFGKEGGKELAKKYDIPLLGEIPLVEDIMEESEMGIPIAVDADHPQAQTFREITDNLVREISKKVFASQIEKK